MKTLVMLLMLCALASVAVAEEKPSLLSLENLLVEVGGGYRWENLTHGFIGEEPDPRLQLKPSYRIEVFGRKLALVAPVEWGLDSRNKGADVAVYLSYVGWGRR